MRADRQRIALTPGEPAGIGPDLAVMLAQEDRDFELVVIGDPRLLLQRAEQLGLDLTIRPADLAESPRSDTAGVLCVHAEACRVPVKAGELNPDNARYVIATLDAAIDGCLDGSFDAMVTAPLHKGVINDAGLPFTGHTEHLAARTDSDVVMMLVANDLRVALATTHLPLADVPSRIDGPLLDQILDTLHQELVLRFGIDDPHILVAGLNPHAGEGGHLGREEITIIEPAVARARERGLRLSGPLPADTLFTAQHLDGADAVLAMYHDQGLPVLKYQGFGRGVNVTLGLPIVRTSVDHGTALDRAGTGQIDDSSLREAVKLARHLAARSRRRTVRPQ